jgi:hypothetical protein
MHMLSKYEQTGFSFNSVVMRQSGTLAVQSFLISFLKTVKNISFLIGCLFAVCSAAMAQTPTVSFVGASRTVAEAAGTVTISLSLSGTAPAPVSVEVFVSSANATAGTDFALSGTMVTFPANSTAVQSVTMTVTNDVAVEADEYLLLRLRNLTGVVAGATPAHLVQIVDNDKATPTPSAALSLSLLTSYRNPTAGSSEIVAYDKTSRRLFIANSVGRRLDIVNFANPAAPVSITAIDISALGNINSVAVQNGIVAIALEGLNPQGNGSIAFYDINGVFQKQVTAGAMPDMIGFSPNGRYVVTPNEGEPNSYSTGGVDPEGSVTIVDLAGGLAALTQANVTTVGFASLNGQRDALRAQGVRIYGRAGNVANGSTVAQDLEPEYAAFTPDSRFAYITLQENNAVLVIDLETKALAPNPIRPLGLKDHNMDRNTFDPTDQGGALTLQKQPVFGMYLPDAIASYAVGGQTFFVTANEGDARDYPGLTEEVRVGAAAYVLDPILFPNAADLKNNQLLGRLTVTNQAGDTDGDGDFDQIQVLGGRSFSILNVNGGLVYDSGDDFERYTRAAFPTLFNASNGNAVAVKDRSDNKGPEPEGVTTAEINGRQYAFITLERIGGVMVYDVTNPSAPTFVNYAINRQPVSNSATDDLGPEGIIYIPAADSPNGRSLLLLANEISNSVSVFQVNAPVTPLVLQTPVYDCTTRQITFQSTGGNGAPVEYRASGVRDWNTNPIAFVEPGVLADRNVSTITIMARQAGGMSVSLTFNFRQACVVAPATSLSLLAPTYNCATRQLTFFTAGGNGSPIEYQAAGVTGWTTNPVAFIESGVVTDPNATTITLMARQNGVMVSRVFNFRQACTSSARIGTADEVADLPAGLTLRTLGNPTTDDAVTVEIAGAAGQPLLLTVVSASGVSVDTKFVEQAGATERQTLRLGRGAGMYLIQASTPAKSRTVSVLKQ